MSSTHRPHRGSTKRLHERLLDLWAVPIPNPQTALAAFAEIYADRISINGTEVPLNALVERAAQTHAALERTSVQVLDILESPGKLVVAFQMTARHIGTWHSTLGDVAPTDRIVTVRTIDVLTVKDGRITAIWVVSDEAALLTQLGAGLSEGVPANQGGRKPRMPSMDKSALSD